MSYATWDIVVVPYPYVDRLVEKNRPALIVSHERLHEEEKLYWLVMITSARSTPWKCDVKISEIENTGLRKPCFVRAAKCVTLSQPRIIQKIGALPPKDRQRVAKKLKAFCGFLRAA